MDNATKARATTAEFSPGTREYAELLIESGFTVYAPVNRDSRTVNWFHYSIGGNYGTFHAGGHDGPDHDMPLKPSRLNGSGAKIAPGDPYSVEYARRVASPNNWSPYAAEPTAEAIRAADNNRGVPARFYRGATLQNCEPWGIGAHYIPVAIAPRHND